MVKLPQHEGIHHHAKKEKRITGRVPEEESRKVEVETEIEGRAGEAQSTPQAQAIRKQLRLA
jgi:exosome complex RNA-binding protein Rrp42 (RNase PH superfamily)